jgi:hypothetical protein
MYARDGSMALVVGLGYMWRRSQSWKHPHQKGYLLAFECLAFSIDVNGNMFEHVVLHRTSPHTLISHIQTAFSLSLYMFFSLLFQRQNGVPVELMPRYAKRSVPEHCRGYQRHFHQRGRRIHGKFART